MRRLEIETIARTEFKDITPWVRREVGASKVREGICMVYVPHTTAAVTINENSDPAVRADLASELDRICPWEGDHQHSEGNSAAHLKASLVGCAVTIPVAEGKLVLGTWQGIFFAEFDGPRRRQVCAQIIGSSSVI